MEILEQRGDSVSLPESKQQADGQTPQVWGEQDANPCGQKPDSGHGRRPQRVHNNTLESDASTERRTEVGLCSPAGVHTQLFLQPLANVENGVMGTSDEEHQGVVRNRVVKVAETSSSAELLEKVECKIDTTSCLDAGQHKTVNEQKDFSSSTNSSTRVYSVDRENITAEQNSSNSDSKNPAKESVLSSAPVSRDLSVFRRFKKRRDSKSSRRFSLHLDEEVLNAGDKRSSHPPLRNSLSAGYVETSKVETEAGRQKVPQLLSNSRASGTALAFSRRSGVDGVVPPLPDRASSVTDGMMLNVRAVAGNRRASLAAGSTSLTFKEQVLGLRRSKSYNCVADQCQPSSDSFHTRLKNAWRSRRSSLKRQFLRLFSFAAKDRRNQVSFVGFRSGGGDKKDNGGSRGGGGSGKAGAGGAAVKVSTQEQLSSSVHTISTGSVQSNSHGDGHGKPLNTKWYVPPPLSSSSSHKSALKTVSVMQSAEPMHQSELGMLLTSSPKSAPATSKTELSSLPMLTPSGLQQTMLAALNQSDPLMASFEFIAAPDVSPEKKQGRSMSQPKGTLEYTVGRNDTLEKIAAKFDTTPSVLMKLNRMSSRLVFEGMTLYRPDGAHKESDPPTPEPSPPPSPVLDVKPKLDVPVVRMENRSPGKLPGHVLKIPSPPLSATLPPEAEVASADSDAVLVLPHALSEDEARKLDEECYERFIKVFAKNCFEGSTEYGRIGVKGTLIITPNAIMFDPDPKDEAVAMYGADSFGMVVYMDCVLSVALYHNLKPEAESPMSAQSPNGILEKKSELFHGDTRGRSASTSELLTAKPRNLSFLTKPLHIATSKSMSGIIGSGKDGVDGKKSASGLSPLPGKADSSGVIGGSSSSGGGLRSLMSLSADTIRIVGDTLLQDSGITVKVEGAESGETTTDLDLMTPLVTVGVDSATQADMDQELAAEELSQLVGGGVPGGIHPATSPPILHDTTQVCSDEDISAFLAGGRRDSLNATGSTLPAGASIFYPLQASPDRVTAQEGEENGGGLKDGEASPAREDKVRQCADRLVTDILESVAHQREETVDGGRRLSAANAPLKGDGAVLTLPSPASPSSSADDSAASAPAPEASRTASSRTRPAPLASLGAGDEVVDGGAGDGSVLPPEGPRGRTSSTGSFSPLRSSAQHISNFVNYATGFFRSSNDDRSSIRDISDIPVVKDLGAEGGRRRAFSGDSARMAKRKWAEDSAAARAREKPDVCHEPSNDDEVAAQRLEESEGRSPIYLELRVDDIECDRRITSTHAPSRSYVGQKTRDRYLFSVPRSKADHLYAFFVHWTPQKYRDEDDIDPEERGFVIVDKEELDRENGGAPTAMLEDYFHATPELKKDWEIISKEEARRRGSVAVDTAVMPELSHESSILSKRDIIELAESLPPRTIGYKWQLVYSTAKHGISLNTLYREVSGMDCPVLLVIRDTDSTVFGAFLSDPPKKSDHFFGTGICQLFTFKDKFRSFSWAGENDFFIKGDDKSLTVGSGHGKYGLWLDGDLYHGRSRQCITFNNIVLSGKEDFIINTLELWAFLMD